MFFSIIMPAFNSEKTIEKSIYSVLKQSYQNFELIIINDNSSDFTGRLLEKFKTNEKIIIVSNDINQGVSISRNKGIEIARGDIIAFLDSDDIWHEDKLNEQLKCFEEGAKIVCSGFSIIDENDVVVGVRKSPNCIKYKDMLKSNLIGNLTGAYSVAFFGKLYQKNIGHEDYVMWLELMSSGMDAVCIQRELASYRISHSSLSGNKIRAISWQWKIYRSVLNMSFLTSGYYFAHYIFNALKKRRN